MSNDEPQFLVNPYDDPVILRIRGKASFLNSAPVKDLLDELVNRQQKFPAIFIKSKSSSIVLLDQEIVHLNEKVNELLSQPEST